MRVLIACEELQTVCKAFRAKGHEAYSCDLLVPSGGRLECHIRGDAIAVLNGGTFTTMAGNIIHIDKWDLVIAHPVCTYLSNSGVRWLIAKENDPLAMWSDRFNKYVNADRYSELIKGARFFNEFLKYGKKGNKIAIENPIQHKYAKSLLGTDYTQIIQPYQFGHLEKKATCLWLFGLQPLQPTNNVYNEMMLLPYAERAKVHFASPGKDRAKIRSKTYEGIAQGMADQWG